MEFKQVLWAVTIFGMVIIAMSVMVDQTSLRYGKSINNDLTDLDKSSDAKYYANQSSGRINPQSGEASSDYEAETFRGAYGIITNIFSSLRMIYGDDGVFQNLADKFEVPSYILTGIITMFVFAIIFAIIAIVFRLGRPV